jgi:hypothetical protein
MSDVNARIQLELVDGAAQKALADFIKSSGAAEKGVGGINKSLGNLKKGTEGASGSFAGLLKVVESGAQSGSAGIGQLASLIGGPLSIGIAAVTSAALVLNKALDFTILAERNAQVENSFNAIAASAGLAGASLKEGLLAATNGLADDNDVLKAANKSIIELGSNADRIPEIMEIARKSTALFGGELVQNFENISSALASGKVETLKNIGLIVNAEAAQKRYAESLGVTVAQLSDSGKKQAIQNEALSQAQIKFKDVDEKSTQATQALARFKVSVNGVGDATAAAVKQSGFFASIFDTLAKASNSVAASITGGFGSDLDKLGVKLSDSRSDVESLTKTVASLEEKLGRSTGTVKIGVVEALDLARTKLTIARLEVDDTIKAIGRLSKASPEGAKPKQENQVNSEAVLKDRADNAKRAADAELAVAQATADLEIEILRNKLANEQITQAEFDKANFDIEQANYAAKQEVEAQRFLDENARLEAARSANLLTEQGYQQQRDSLAAQFAAKGIKYDADSLKSATKLAQEKEKLKKQELDNAANFFGGFAALMQTQNRDLFAIGKAAAIAQASINGYEAITKAYAQTGFFGGPIAAAAVGIATGVQIANIASTNPSFASGGIVPGTSYNGDRVTANVNSGEMIITRQQQTDLFRRLDSGSFGGDGEVKGLLRSIASAIQNQDTSVSIDGKEIVSVLRTQLASGRRFD